MISRQELNREVAEQLPEGVSQEQYRQIQKMEKSVQARRMRGTVVVRGPMRVGVGQEVNNRKYRRSKMNK